jgi:hypothetical protein
MPCAVKSSYISFDFHPSNRRSLLPETLVMNSWITTCPTPGSIATTPVETHSSFVKSLPIMPVVRVLCTLKGTWNEIYDSRFFSWISVLRAPGFTMGHFEHLEYRLSFRTFTKIREYIRKCGLSLVSMTPAINGTNFETESFILFCKHAIVLLFTLI